MMIKVFLRVQHNVMLHTFSYIISNITYTQLHYLTEAAPPETDENSSLNRDPGSRVRGLGGGIINGSI